MSYNTLHGITPRSVSKRIKDIIDGVYDAAGSQREGAAAEWQSGLAVMDEKQMAREIKRLEKEMMELARNLEFEKAAITRDALTAIKRRLFGVLPGEAESAAI